MSIIAVLEVAIGMIFVWLVMSLAGMYMQEWIVGKLKWRSSMLEIYIGNLLVDQSLARQFYDHPLIQGLQGGVDGETLPAYIPARQFSMSLLDIIRNAPKEAALIQQTLYDLQNEIDGLSKNKQVEAHRQLDIALEITKRAVASEAGPETIAAILDEVKKRIRKLSSDFPDLQNVIETKFLEFAIQKKQIDSILANLQANHNSYPDVTKMDQFKIGLAVMSVTHPDIKQALEALSNEIEEFGEKTESTLKQVGRNLEEWFNNAMDRLSGWYKRRSQTLAFFIAIFLAVLLNVDSLQLATQLWRDPAVRQALAAQADALVQKNPDGLSTPDASQLLALHTQISQLNIPVGWIGTPLPADSSGAVAIGDNLQKLCTLSPQSGVDLFGLHLGDQCYPIINTPWFNDLTGWLLKLFGLLITGTAAAQGAPFWFDILKNLVNVRSTGVNSDAAPKGVK